jgi:hypothetical protein
MEGIVIGTAAPHDIHFDSFWPFHEFQKRTVREYPPPEGWRIQKLKTALHALRPRSHGCTPQILIVTALGLSGKEGKAVRNRNARQAVRR